MYRGNHTAHAKETKAVYEDDHAIFMLSSMFNQFPSHEIVLAFKESNSNFFNAMNKLLAKQKATGTKPKTAKLPDKQANLSRGDESPAVKNHTITYTSPSKNFDYKRIVKWKTFNMQNEEHLLILKDQTDPCSWEDLLEVGMSGQDEIIQLPCATRKMRCNFTKTSIIESFRAKPECPVCKTIYPLPGKMPSGTMRVSFDKRTDCQGFAGDGSIVMQFNFKSGTQGLNHNNPGQAYYGGSRTAYVPHVEEGKKALLLLEETFRRGELFTIGRSLTTGQENTLTYGSIHLKTSPSGGTTAHGWPDFTYFQRLRDECAAKMIFDPEVAEEMKKTEGKPKSDTII